VINLLSHGSVVFALYCRCYGFSILTKHYAELGTWCRIIVPIWPNCSGEPNSNLYTSWPVHRYLWLPDILEILHRYGKSGICVIFAYFYHLQRPRLLYNFNVFTSGLRNWLSKFGICYLKFYRIGLVQNFTNFTVLFVCGIRLDGPICMSLYKVNHACLLAKRDLVIQSSRWMVL